MFGDVKYKKKQSYFGFRIRKSYFCISNTYSKVSILLFHYHNIPIFDPHTAHDNVALNKSAIKQPANYPTNQQHCRVLILIHLKAAVKVIILVFNQKIKVEVVFRSFGGWLFAVHTMKVYEYVCFSFGWLPAACQLEMQLIISIVGLLAKRCECSRSSVALHYRQLQIA